jgi:hypothetical protein
MCMLCVHVCTWCVSAGMLCEMKMSLFGVHMCVVLCCVCMSIHGVGGCVCVCVCVRGYVVSDEELRRKIFLNYECFHQKCVL